MWGTDNGNPLYLYSLLCCVGDVPFPTRSALAVNTSLVATSFVQNYRRTAWIFWLRIALDSGPWDGAGDTPPGG